MAFPFNGQNWLIVPATPLLPPDQIANQKWLLTLTGVFATNFVGKQTTSSATPGFSAQDFDILPDVQSPLNFALSTYGIPHPGASQHAVPFFSPDPDAAPFMNVSGLFELGKSFPGGGFATERWTVNVVGSDDLSGNPINVFQGVTVRLLAQNLDTVNRICYNMTLLGQIVFIKE